jgi:hypothetical protein
LLAIINTSPRPLREIRPMTPPELEAIIAKAMARNRSDRYPTAKHFLRELSVPVPETSGPRLPPPPTAEERKRAPVLGGGRPAPDLGSRRSVDERVEAISRASRRAPDVPRPPSPYDTRGPEGPVATLRSAMTEPTPVFQSLDTRVDVRTTSGLSPYGPPPLPSNRHQTPLPSLRSSARSFDDNDDSIDIPIHVGLSEDEEVEGHDLDEETEIFRPGHHPLPVPGRAQKSSRAGKRKSSAPPPPGVAPDDWDGETIVTRNHPNPAMPNVARPVHAPTPRRKRGDNTRPFNPDETMKIENTGDIEIVDEAPPRRR